MSKRQRTKRGGRPDGRGASVAIEMERLRERYELFRRGHERGTRIPDELRAATLAAQDSGASAGQLHRACQVSSDQLRQWRAQLRGCGASGAGGEPSARVFDVVDDHGALQSAPIGERSSPELQLRVGGWAVRISQQGE